MPTKKISLDLEEEIYFTLKRDALENRTTMSKIIRGLLSKRYDG